MLTALSIPLLAVLAFADSDVPLDTGMVETIGVQAHYLCDGYDSYGDASFYDCARRFFMEGTTPIEEGQLKGQWRCRSALNGPTANHEQTIKIGHYRKGKPGKSGFTDRLLVQKIFTDSPKPKQMYRDHLYRPQLGGVKLNSLVGEIARADLEWVSTNWAYVQVTTTINIFGGDVPRFHDTRAAFRFYKGSVLIEHVTPSEDRDQLWKVLSEDPRSTVEREGVRGTVAGGELPTTESAIRMLDELIRDEIYQNGSPYRTVWTKESIQLALPIADYPAAGDDPRDWSFPITYSECQRYWSD